MSGAADEAASLRQAIVASVVDARLEHTVGALKAELRLMMGSVDLLDSMGAAADVLLAAEALRDAADMVHRTTRKVLAASMLDTGAVSFRTATHAVAAVEGVRDVVYEPNGVPAEFMRQPPPSPDKAAIRKHLLTGASCNWASLGARAEPHIRLTALKKEAV